MKNKNADSKKPKKEEKNDLDNWSPSSWRNHLIKQAPSYEDQEDLQRVEQKLSSYPPLIFAKEVDLLKTKLQKVALGEAFILQGGDCAESFSRFSADSIRDFYKLILQMSIILGFSSQKEIIKLGRIAGQFAKPRSQDFEEKEGIKLPIFRGDMINSLDFNPSGRKHDPQRMLQAYHQSTATLNLLRAFSKGGMADFHLFAQYILDFAQSHPLAQRYKTLANQISQALCFAQSCGINLETMSNFCEFFTSHEALLLHYEEALCRTDSLSQQFYDCSAHFLWIGERTLSSPAHLEFIRGIQNPKGLKVSTRTPINELLKALDLLNPSNQKGEIALIIRMGEEGIQTRLPPLIQSIQQHKKEVIWMSDPMHGNTMTKNGIKTRQFSSIINELAHFFSITREFGVYAGGVHLEMTGEDVTECIGGSITQEGLQKNYITQCDPRLNATQSLDLAFWLADQFEVFI
ncbi:3-deoxy-7-phosphoheptulonate synthase class II [Helicobacter kayseriensis]|uniref:3-deoxy-7-phosphoheptulonate synthase class II n=1 Tax=Helicobacter kayseriensis TaxID=2905877 RepID=UPI001E54442D|nr:3-deoxy-7-phosphoheptulonate synthase class II [Helicobacter kayseriensis]MCE3048175.1 3-deoxy-7-phosphoheptulonate synthase [Helicobacter kayseriensis]